MPKINVEGTEFEFSIMPFRLFADKYWARTKIAIKNEYVHYEYISETISLDELEKWIFGMFRLLAGAYEKPRSLEFERAKLSVDFVPMAIEGEEVTRQSLRENDCIMSIRLLLQSAKTNGTVGGVYSLLLHRDKISEFAKLLKGEFYKTYKKHLNGKGKYLFVGVSPFRFEGCNYWYLATNCTVAEGDYVWVRMGRRKIEQVAFVDSVRKANEDTAPYPFSEVKRIIRKATIEEIEEWKNKL